MKSDKDLFKELQERNRSVRLFTEAHILELMAKARKELTDDHKKRIPNMVELQKEFSAMLEKSKTDPKLVSGYSRLTEDKKAWVWFTQGAAAALKKFKEVN